jgi:hypothetical protein
MPTLPLHPAIVHLPLGLALVLPLLAVAVGLAVWRGRLPRGAFAVLFGLQLVLVGTGALSMKLGERDGDRVEKVIPERLIEAHEERAEAFLLAAVVVLVGAGALLVLPARALAGASAAVALGTLVVAGLGIRTGEAGGALVYQHGAASAFLPGAGPASGVVPASAHGEREHDRD